jgi:hypothetical protein
VFLYWFPTSKLLITALLLAIFGTSVVDGATQVKVSASLLTPIAVLTWGLLVFSAGRDHFPQGPQPMWVQELVAESRSHNKGDDCDDSLKSHISSHAIRSIPRTVEQMGSALDGTDFWTTFGISPDVPWVD